MLINFERSRNDLHTFILCPHCYKSIYLTGYYDDNFFKNVHSHPHADNCPNCNASYWYQWKPSHIQIEWLND